jgi:deoxyadenosine/deoxycytidine kinase
MDADTKRLPESLRYLCIEGVIGAGKTSLCDKLARLFNLQIIHEIADENPFLSQFYRNRDAFAFQTQLWFLLSRQRQLTDGSSQPDLFHQGIVADYLFDKDSIFAALTLDENEMAMYRNINAIIKPTIARPDFVVYLQASTETLLRRIEKRGRRYERNMDAAYIESLNQAYNHFFFHYNDTPLLIINTNEIDFVNNTEDFQDIVGQLLKAGPGTQYYHSTGRSVPAPADKGAHA